MCKLIKKSCLVIALSFMSFAFYSGSANSALLLAGGGAASAAGQGNSTVAGQAAAETYKIIVIAHTSKGNKTIIGKNGGIDVKPGERIYKYKFTPGRRYTVEIRDRNGLSTQEIDATNRDLVIYKK